MAFDIELRIVHSQIVDLSENAEQLSTAGGSVEGVNQLTLGRRGFPQGSFFTVHIEEGSVDASADPLKFVFQVQVDGTNWHDLSTVHFIGNSTIKTGAILSAPIGLVDLRTEIGTRSVVTRVAARYTDGGVTDDVTYSAYITGPTGFPPINT